MDVFIKKFVFLFVIAEFFALIPCFTSLEARRKKASQSIDYDSETYYDNGNKKNNKKQTSSFMPYLLAGGVLSTIIVAFILTRKNDGQPNQGDALTTGRRVPNRSTTEDLRSTAHNVIQKAKLLSTYDTLTVSALCDEALQPGEMSNFLKILGDKCPQVTFNMPFEWIAKADSTLLAGRLSQEELDFFYKVIERLLHYIATPEGGKRYSDLKRILTPTPSTSHNSSTPRATTSIPPKVTTPEPASTAGNLQPKPTLPLPTPSKKSITIPSVLTGNPLWDGLKLEHHKKMMPYLKLPEKRTRFGLLCDKNFKSKDYSLCQLDAAQLPEEEHQEFMILFQEACQKMQTLTLLFKGLAMFKQLASGDATYMQLPGTFLPKFLPKNEIFITLHNVQNEQEVTAFQALLKKCSGTITTYAEDTFLPKSEEGLRNLSTLSEEDLQLLSKGLSHACNEWTERKEALENLKKDPAWEKIKDTAVKTIFTQQGVYQKFMEELHIPESSRENISLSRLEKFNYLYLLSAEQIKKLTKSLQGNQDSDVAEGIEKGLQQSHTIGSNVDPKDACFIS